LLRATMLLKPLRRFRTIWAYAVSLLAYHLMASAAAMGTAFVTHLLLTSRRHHHAPIRPSSIMQQPRRLTPTVSMSVSSSRAAALDSFKQWLANKGVKSDSVSVDVKPSDVAGLGLICTKPIKRGEAAASVPMSLSITKESATQTPMREHLEGAMSDNSEMAMLALYLLYEKSKGDASEIAPWLAVLPTKDELNNPILWSDGERAELARSTTKAISTWLEERSLEFMRLQRRVMEKHPNVFDPATFTLENYQWAMAVVTSRSFFVDSRLRMTPLVDFVNHDPAANVEPDGARESGGCWLLMLCCVCVCVCVCCVSRSDGFLGQQPWCASACRP